MGDQEILSSRLVEVRKKNGYTRRRLAEELGRPYRTVTNYENGEHEPGHKYLVEISKKFGVTVDYLVGRSDVPQPEIKKAPSYSDGALKLADDYDNHLDNWGRQAIRDLMDTEVARVADEARFTAPLEEPEPKVIPLYLYPAAAGYISPVMNEDYEPYELGPDDPPGAEFAVRLQGDSMEPDFPDGSRVFCNHDPLANGDIGVFCVDSGIVCKQYYKDPVGFVYLFSLNRKRATSDLLISPEGNRSLTCHGRVITRKHYPIPGKG